MESAFESWDQFLMTQVYYEAMKSKDPSTKIGAVIVHENKEKVSTGFNGFPRGVEDDYAQRWERPEKYYFCEHAERNAIYNAARIGIPTLGATIYTQGTPCPDCARGIIQAGIKELVIHEEWNMQISSLVRIDWNDISKRSMQMFEESGVTVRSYDGPIVHNIYAVVNGQKNEFGGNK